MAIRQLLSEDAPDFQSLRLRGLLECPEAFTSSHAEEVDSPLDVLAQRLSPKPDGAVFGYFSGTNLVGLIGVQREGRLKLSHKAFIWGMYVTPTHRRRSVGRQLVQSVLSHAASLPGLRRVNLGVNAANPQAIALYEATGFKPYGVEKAFLVVDDVEQDEVHMSYVIARA